MNKIKLLATTALLLLLCTTVQAQFGKILGKAIENAAKNATVHKAEQKTDEAVSGAIDKATDTKTYKGEGKGEGGENASEGNNKSGKAAPQQNVKADEMSWNKFDFVSGDQVMFDDQLTNETLGEFPSQWDLLMGNAEIAKVNGQNAISFVGDRIILTPLMKTPKNYLPESFTIELDFYVGAVGKVDAYWRFELKKPNNDNDVFRSELWVEAKKSRDIGAWWTTATGEDRNSSTSIDLSAVGWHRLSISFNKRALKVYIDQTRVVNVPNVAQPGWFTVEIDHAWTYKEGYYIRDIRIAKGAVPLYDRLASEGKIITYGITFDVGKSTIKPESMGEINRIAQLMKDNPDVKFSVEGHTDNTGNAASNQTLSEARSKAVMDKLVEMGIASDRLKAAGKGQTKPIADNSTDEGRAKNRRVEFVKI